MSKRKRMLGSIKSELLIKSREAMLTSVQIFNNPNIQFKSESFIVLSVIAWTYLLHAYYRDNNIEYRYYQKRGMRRRFDKTKFGAYKYWELERCLNDENCPIDKVEMINLKFLIGLRHEIEHQMTTKIDDYLSARFQASCLNYNKYIKKLFDDKLGIDKHLSFSLQFSSISEKQVAQLREFTDLPANISSYITDYDESINDAEYNDMRFSYRVLYVPKSVNNKGQADKVIEFVPAKSEVAEKLNTEYVLIKEREKPKYIPSNVVNAMREKGYPHFSMHNHTSLWQTDRDKYYSPDYGTRVAGHWYWYQKWFDEVEQHCSEKEDLYK